MLLFKPWKAKEATFIHHGKSLYFLIFIQASLFSYILGGVYRLYRAPAVGDLGRPGPPRRPGHPRHLGGQQRLVPVADTRQPSLLLQRAQGG